MVVDGKPVCKTKFSDLIEIMGGPKIHPVGRHNQITRDRAFLNFALSFLAMTFSILGALDLHTASAVYLFFAIIFYFAQLIEAWRSSTMRTLWQQNKWIEFNVFKVWFHELKKCRPVLKF